MVNKMLIDATHPEETRVVVLRGNRVEEFDFETAHRKQLRGNIYLAKVTRVEPSLQAAFVDYGGNRHGFLAFGEIHPDYYQIPVADRQALIEADARAARDEDEEYEAEPGRRRRRGPARNRRESQAARRRETVSGEVPAAEEPASDLAEAPAGESIPDEPVPEQTPTGFATDAQADPVPAPAEPGPTVEQYPFGETEALLISGDIASDPTEPQPAPAREFELALPAEPAAPEISPTEDAAPETAGSADHHNGGDVNGADHNGADEEEEVVESVGGADAMEEVPDRAPRARRQYKIQEVIKRRQIMLVQVVKEERGTKGAALTTYLSLAGRYCVLMPNTARGGGISRKITSADDRKKLREIAEDLQVPEGMGVILRTAGANRTKAEVKRDFEYLLRLWEQVRDLTLKSTAPTLVYEEGSLAKRSIRDLYSKDIDEIVVAGEAGYRDVKEFMRMLMPSHAKNVKLYKDTQPVFTRFGIESQLDAMFSPTVQLRSGGYIVINQTEALVSIDVNSGRSTREHHIEDTALKTNVEAAEEIARQLRLRDLAGLIVIDFIDMDEKRNNRTVERRLKDALRNDRARIQVGRISHFGLLEMSRQRIRSSVLESSTEKCAHCGGTGHVRSVSSVALQLLRSLEEALLKGPTHNLIVRTRPEIAPYVLNQKRAHLHELEARFHIAITINADPEVGGQIGFAVDRGEQVMTPDQARALVARAEAAPTLVEEEVKGESAEEWQTAEAADEPEEHERETAEGASAQDEGEPGREGGRGRRRRRRRRGRGGEDREPEHAASDAAAAGAVAPFGEPVPTTEATMDADDGEAHPEDKEPHAHGDGDGDGNGDRRRRRRGRRGGRRNRRERVGAEEFAPGSEREAPEPSEPAEAPAWSAHPQSHDVAAEPVAPEIESAAPQANAAPPAPEPPEAEPPRRRSTIREPAPVLSEDAPVVMAMPTPQSSPQQPRTAMAEPGSDEATEPDKPRRTGWWAKRLMGGGKG